MLDGLTKPELFRTTATQCGTRFDIGTAIKDTTFQPGSVGYMSFALGPDESCPNVMFYNTVIVRRGQKGKLRVEQNILLAPIFIIPGIPLEFTVPVNEERKYFVDINPIILETTNFLNTDNDQNQVDVITDIEHHFLAHTLSKGLFFTELDSASKPIEHPLMKKLNINGDNPRQRVFHNKKHSSFHKLICDVEGMVRDGQTAVLFDAFWNPLSQSIIIDEMHNIEVALTLPILEYNRKVNNVLKSAIEYIINRLKSNDGKAFKNSKVLIKSAEMTHTAINFSDLQLSKQIERRLNHIIKNRELVKSEGPVLVPSFASGKKVTHVFSGYQS